MFDRIRLLYLSQVQETKMQKFITALVVFLVAGLTPAPMGCSAGFDPVDTTATTETGDQGGYTPTDVIYPPFAAGEVYQCTQGVGGSYSHSSASTYDAIDFDTPNTYDVDVYAPCSGVARVHHDASPSGFGIHVNIDRGDGTYCLVAHLADVFVTDGEDITHGQYMGFEGSTGYSDGDHVHTALMQGDASQMAQYATTLPVSFYVRDVTAGGDFAAIPAEEFVCGMSNGHFYESGLSVANWVPDGTLMKYPGASEVYVVDADELYWIEDEEVFTSFGFEMSEIVAMAEITYYECLGEASDLIDWTTEYRGLIDDDGVTWIAFEPADDPGRFRLPIQPYQEEGAVLTMIDSWGLQGVYGMYQQESAELIEYPIGNGYALLRDGTLVTEQGDSTVYAIHEGLALPIDSWDTLVLMGFSERRVHTVPEGTLEQMVLDVGSCSAGIGCITRDVVTGCGTGLDLSLLDTDPDWGGIGDDDVGDDDDVSDDDDSDPGDDDDTADDDDTGDDDDVGDDDDDDTMADPWMLLEIYAGLTGAPADYIWLQGELLDENGLTAGGGFWWASLGIEYTTNSIEWSAYVQPDWTFRYSVEFERYSVVAWSCSTPFPPGTYNMDLTAMVDGTPIMIDLIDNYLGGCELWIEVP